MSVVVKVRPAVATDMGLVFDSWLRAYLCQVKDGAVVGGAATSEMRKDDYFAFQRGRIDRLLETRAHVVVAHPEEAPNVIASWACLDDAPNTFHYVFTMEARRRNGYAKLLVGDRLFCTHLTDYRRTGGTGQHPGSFAAWKRRAGFRYLPHVLDHLGASEHQGSVG